MADAARAMIPPEETLRPNPPAIPRTIPVIIRAIRGTAVRGVWGRGAGVGISAMNSRSLGPTYELLVSQTAISGLSRINLTGPVDPPSGRVVVIVTRGWPKYFGAYKMLNMQRIFMESVEKFPELAVAEILKKKLSDQKLDNFDDIVTNLARDLISGKTGPFIFDDGDSNKKDIILEFTAEDGAYLDDKAKKFAESLPDIFENVAEETAISIVRRARKAWSESQGYDIGELAAFRHNLQFRWGRGLGSLKFLLMLSREIGEEYMGRAIKSRSRKNISLRGALIQLHTRCCQITGEIITLLENGFADGAMARWRTLHEVAIVITVLSEGGDDLAVRYLDHEAVESKRAMDSFTKTHIELGWKSPSKRDVQLVEREFAAVRNKYGIEFCSDYGWAVPVVKSTRPKFSDLERLAGRAIMRPHYKMASYNVHASVKGITSRLGDLDKSDALIAGASNAGIEEPGLNTAITIVQSNIPLLGNRLTFDNIIKLKVLQKVQEHAISEFLRSAGKLRADEFRLRRSGRK